MQRRIEIDSSGHEFHRSFASEPHRMSTITPNQVYGCDLHEGNWGSVGCVFNLDYNHGGERESIRKRIVEIREEEHIKSIRYEVTDGRLMESYRNFFVTHQVDTRPVRAVVTWTCEYEKLHQNHPDPTAFMDFCVALTRSVEAHHLSMC